MVGKGSREGSLKPADSMTPSGPLPIFTKLLQDECCRIGDTLRLSCQGIPLFSFFSLDQLADLIIGINSSRNVAVEYSTFYI